jgi:tetratricopeptide (TPR) repeat protein
MVCVAFALGAGCVSANAEPRIALVIGNGAYSPTLGKLANPVSDAKMVAAALKRVGFDVDLETDLNQVAMKRAIARLGQRLRKAGSGATGLFYYAGHGLQEQGENFLIPIDADIQSEADIDIYAVAAKGVLDQMTVAEDAVNIVILDACRNTPVLRTRRSTDRGLARMDAPPGSFIGYSTAPGQTALDGSIGGNSPFAAALASELTRPGVPIDSLFINVRKRVLAATANKQLPWDSSSLVNEFYFAGGRSADTVPVLSKPAPAPSNKTPQLAMIPPKAQALDATAQTNLCASGASVSGCTWAIQSGKWQGEDLAWAYYDRAIAYGAEGKNELSVADYTDAIRLKPNYADAFGNRCQSYLNLHRYDLAIADCSNALRIRPDATDFYDRALGYYDKAQYQQSVEDYTQAIRLKPNYADALGNRCMSYMSLHQYDLALADCSSALRIRPDVTDFYNRATSYYAKAQYQQAVDDYSEAIRLKPNYAPALSNRCWSYLTLQQVDLAIADCTSALGIRPDATDFYERGLAYYDKRQYQLSVEDYTQAIRLKPNYADALGNRCSSYITLHQNDLAMADCSSALRIRPDSIDFYNRGSIYYNTGQYQQAVDDYTQSIALKADYAPALYFRGLARKTLGDQAGGDADIARARALDPNVGK